MSLNPKVVIVCHKSNWKNRLLPIMEMFETFFDVSWFYIDDHGWPTSVYEFPQYMKQDAIIWFVGFKHLLRKLRLPFDWGKFTGPRIMYDLDTSQNYSTFAGKRYYGKWPIVYRRHRFDALVCTGEMTAMCLRTEGVNAIWIPKAFDGKRFYDKGRGRRGLCYFGRKYSVRKEMLDFVGKEIPIRRIRGSFFQLNDLLNRHKACLIHNGSEALLKQFEVPASGCVPVCNNIPELLSLGFIDGINMISYDSFDEIVDKLRYYFDNPDQLSTIGKHSAQWAKEHHTWGHRSEKFRRLICST